MASALIGSGQGPGSNPLTLGSVKFNSSEAPVSLAIGVEQMATSQTQAGGGRVVQTFGVSPKEITWTGRLFGEFVQARVAQLRLYCTSGNPVLLSWVKATSTITGNALQSGQPNPPLSQIKELYRVIVKEFTPTFFAQYAEYSITLVTVQAKNGAYAALPPGSIDTQINALQAQAVTLTNTLIASSGTASLAVQQKMLAVKATIQAATPISQNPLAAANIQQTIQQAQVAISAFSAAQKTGSNPLATAIALSGTLTAISRNVAAGYSPKSVTQQGGNAFTIAAQYYGDVSQAFTLAQIAGIPSPFLPTGQFSTLQLPKLNASPSKNQASSS
jgi:hypothetical protein